MTALLTTRLVILLLGIRHLTTKLANGNHSALLLILLTDVSEQGATTTRSNGERHAVASVARTRLVGGLETE